MMVNPLSLPAYKRIAPKILGASFVALALTLLMVSGTLWLSWQLEGSSAAINDSGSLRMRAYRLALTLQQGAAASQIDQQVAQIDAILAELNVGNPARPVMLPATDPVRRQFELVRDNWHAKMRPLALNQETDSVNYVAQVPVFTQQVDQLVALVESNSAQSTRLLRFSQFVLIALAIVGTVAITYLLYLWIIRPLARLHAGLKRMAAHEFEVRLPVETDDEFGQLTRGFNRMAQELDALYRGLEMRVQHKTAQLEAQNRELSALYSMAEFLAHPDTIESLSRGFLQRICATFKADGGSLRLLSTDGAKMHLVTSEGLSDEMAEKEYSQGQSDCICTRATENGTTIIRDFRNTPHTESYPCEKEGYVAISAFQIVAQQRVIGSFALHFRQACALNAVDTQLLQTFGQQLGAALESLRLQAREKQLAVIEERNLVSQGLHDSLAQSLNFLNLQVQMLERELKADRPDKALAHLPLLRSGVEQSYQDVRELLANFRSRLESVDLQSGLADILARLRLQTGIETKLDIRGDGSPLPAEQQLQLLFIVQEALSNIRKHAQARQVTVNLLNRQDFQLEIIDDGCGFDPAQQAARSQDHFGLRIMRERAEKMQGVLTVQSAPGQGCKVVFALLRHERVAA